MEGYVPYQKKVLSKLVEMYLYFPLYRYLYISGGLHDFWKIQRAYVRVQLIPIAIECPMRLIK